MATHSRRLVSQSEYARHRGVGRSAVSKAVSSGRITLIDGKIDPDVADVQWKNNTDSLQSIRRQGGHSKIARLSNDLTPSDSNSIDYMEWKARRERAEALRAEQNQHLEAGNLCYKDEVERGAKTVGRLVRDQLLSIPSRLAAELAVMSDANTIEQHIRQEIRAALLTITRQGQSVIVEENDEA